MTYTRILTTPTFIQSSSTAADVLLDTDNEGDK